MKKTKLSKDSTIGKTVVFSTDWAITISCYELFLIRKGLQFLSAQAKLDFLAYWLENRARKIKHTLIPQIWTAVSRIVQFCLILHIKYPIQNKMLINPSFAHLLLRHFKQENVHSIWSHTF